MFVTVVGRVMGYCWSGCEVRVCLCDGGGIVRCIFMFMVNFFLWFFIYFRAKVDEFVFVQFL